MDPVSSDVGLAAIPDLLDDVNDGRSAVVDLGVKALPPLILSLLAPHASLVLLVIPGLDSGLAAQRLARSVVSEDSLALTTLAVAVKEIGQLLQAERATVVMVTVVEVLLERWCV